MTMINPVPNKSQSQSKSHPQSKRRSLSVSAVSRKTTTSSPDIELFSNKRDNPLFWTAGSRSSSGDSPTQQNPSSLSSTIAYISGEPKSSRPALTAGQRGRSVSRNSDHLSAPAASSSRPRSRSRVDIDTTARSRGRSVSRHTHPPSESEEVKRLQQQQSFSRNRSISSNSTHNQASSAVKKSISSSSSLRNANANAAADTLHNSRKSFQSQSRPDLFTSHSSPSADSTSGLQISSWEDGISTSSLSEAEEKTIKAVYEQMKSIKEDHLRGDTGTSGIYETVRSEVRRALSDIQLDLETAIRRNNAAAIANADVTDIPPDLVKPGAVELVLDIRREYAKKLDESRERARKLRQDLAVEEHRGQELSRILKETLPDPKTSTTHRSRIGRKTSSERKKMSKRLTDEAMSYFDECVSISTFDSSDFSAAEDSAFNSVGTALTSSLPQESPCSSSSCRPESCLNHKQLIHSSSQDASITANSKTSCNVATVDQASERDGSTRELGKKFQFSFVHKSTENTAVRQQGVRGNYYMIKDFKEENIIIDKGEMFTSDSSLSSDKCHCYDIDDGSHSRESLLFDKVHLRNRIQSGSLNLCGGGAGIAISFSPYASLI